MQGVLLSPALSKHECRKFKILQPKLYTKYVACRLILLVAAPPQPRSQASTITLLGSCLGAVGGLGLVEFRMYEAYKPGLESRIYGYKRWSFGLGLCASGLAAFPSRVRGKAEDR